MKTPKTPDDLLRYINSTAIAAEIVPVSAETPTVPLAAAALGVAASQIVKSLLFQVRDSPILVIAQGDRLVDKKELAARFGVGKKQIRLADPEIVLELTGYEVGGVPPFGHATQIPTLLDRAILAWDFVYGGGGDDHTLLRVAPEELARVTSGEWIELER